MVRAHFDMSRAVNGARFSFIISVCILRAHIGMEFSLNRGYVVRCEIQFKVITCVRSIVVNLRWLPKNPQN
jgi:hypothetical protein